MVSVICHQRAELHLDWHFVLPGIEADYLIHLSITLCSSRGESGRHMVAEMFGKAGFSPQACFLHHCWPGVVKYCCITGFSPGLPASVTKYYQGSTQAYCLVLPSKILPGFSPGLWRVVATTLLLKSSNITRVLPRPVESGTYSIV